MKYDRVVRGGTVVFAGGRFPMSIAISDGKIAAVGSDEDWRADDVVDASGHLVMPGMVDVHVHTREPGYTHKEDMRTCTRAAAAGGVTTVFAMPNLNPPPSSVGVLRDILDLYDESSYVDFNINPAATVPDEIEPMAKEGVAAFKVYMVVDTGRDYPHPSGVGIHDHGKLLELMERIAPTGLPFMVHPHDQALMNHIEQQHWKAGDRSPAAYANTLAAHDGLIWDTAVAVLLRLAEATGCRLHIVHAQTVRTVEMLREARLKIDVTAEVNHWALFLGSWADVERLGPYALSYHVPDHAREALWAGLADGTIDILASDHAAHTRAEKEVGWNDMWAAHTGTPGIQFQLPLLLDAALTGRITIDRAIDMATSRPAHIFGLENKGRIAPGADADLVIIDMDDPWTITNDAALTKVGWTPYDGRKVAPRVVRTMVRGVDVFRNGEIVGRSGHGRQVTPTRRNYP